MMVAVGTMDGEQAFSREVGIGSRAQLDEVIAEMIFESSACVTSVKQFRVGAFDAASTGCCGETGWFEEALAMLSLMFSMFVLKSSIKRLQSSVVGVVDEGSLGLSNRCFVENRCLGLFRFVSIRLE